MKFKDQDVTKRNGDVSNGRYSKENSNENSNICKLPLARKSKKSERRSNVNSSLNSSDTVDDLYLESLRQRHLSEKEMIDRILNQKLRT